MLSPENLVEFALLEYRRDSQFASFVDLGLQKMIEAKVINGGPSDLASRLSIVLHGNPLAKCLLDAYHRASGTPQWMKR